MTGLIVIPGIALPAFCVRNCVLGWCGHKIACLTTSPCFSCFVWLRSWITVDTQNIGTAWRELVHFKEFSPPFFTWEGIPLTFWDILPCTELVRIIFSCLQGRQTDFGSSSSECLTIPLYELYVQVIIEKFAKFCKSDQYKRFPTSTEDKGCKFILS